MSFVRNKNCQHAGEIMFHFSGSNSLKSKSFFLKLVMIFWGWMWKRNARYKPAQFESNTMRVYWQIPRRWDEFRSEPSPTGLSTRLCPRQGVGILWVMVKNRTLRWCHSAWEQQPWLEILWIWHPPLWQQLKGTLLCRMSVWVFLFFSHNKKML